MVRSFLRPGLTKMLVSALHEFVLRTGKRDIELVGVVVGDASDIYPLTLNLTS